MEYNHKKIEAKWKKYWEENGTFKTDVWDFSKPKYYALDMFPYPSGAGLHVGHPEGYTATDIVSRMKRMQGYNVLHPIGFDSFGLPAEQYAIDTGNNPADFTEKNIKFFIGQLKNIGFSFDWDITSGRSGYLNNFTLKDWQKLKMCRLTGVRNWDACLPMMKLLMAKVSAAAIQLLKRICCSGL